MRALVLFGLAGCAAIAQAPSAAQFVASRLSANDLKADVSFLASDALEGRDTPSRGLDIAAEYIAAQFRRAGLEPAGDDGYFQTASFETAAMNRDGLNLTVTAGGKTFKADAASLSMQDPMAVDVQDASVIKASLDAAELEKLTPEKVKGKVLVLAMPDPGGIGGRGALAITRRIPGILARLQPAMALMLGSANGRGGRGGPRLRETVTSQATPSAPVLTVADSQIRTALEGSDAAGATISAHVAAPVVAPAKLRNVIGALRGSDPVLKDTYLLITAHYDHLGVRDNGTPDRIFNGANDDASGAASVIEIANTLAKLPARPKRTIVFMTQFGEEKGDLGSRYYAQHPIFPLAKTIADVNLEQVGRTDDTQGPHVGMFNLTGFDFTDLPEIFRKAGKETGIQVVKDAKNSDPYFTRSDNAAFANVGIPSTTLSVAYDFPDYHKAGDEWQKIDYENMAKVDRTVALAALDLANSAAQPKWNEKNPKTEEFIKARGERGKSPQ